MFKKFLGDAAYVALRTRLRQSEIHTITISNAITGLIFPFHEENLIQIYHNGTGRNPWPRYNLAKIFLVTFLAGRKLFGQLNCTFCSYLSPELLSRINVAFDTAGWKRTLQLLFTLKWRYIPGQCHCLVPFPVYLRLCHSLEPFTNLTGGQY